MLLKQFYLPCLAHASYLVADERTRVAAVVDPQRDIDQYLAYASEHRLQIAHVFLRQLRLQPRRPLVEDVAPAGEEGEAQADAREERVRVRPVHRHAEAD